MKTLVSVIGKRTEAVTAGMEATIRRAATERTAIRTLTTKR